MRQDVRFFGFVPAPHAGGALPDGVRVRVPLALRGLRSAAARGDGLRHAGRDLAPLVAARGGRRRRAARRSLQRGGRSPRASTRLLDDADLRQRLIERGRVRAASFSWERSVRQGTPATSKALGRRRSPPRLEATSVRVALVHDWLTGMRGGEKVLLSLARLFPEAPIFTLLHVRGSVAPELEAARDPNALSSSACPRSRALPPLPAALPGGRRRARPARLRPRASRARTASPRACAPAPGARPRLLLPHADALRLGPLRRLLRPGPRLAARAARRCVRVAATRCAPGTCATAARVAPLRREQPITSPARIRRYYGRESRGDPAARRHRASSPPVRIAPGDYDLSSLRSRPTSASSWRSTPIAAPAGRCGSSAAVRRPRACARSRRPEARFLGQRRRRGAA